MKYKITNNDNGKEFVVDDEYLNIPFVDFVESKVSSYGENPTIEVINEYDAKQKELLDASWAWIERWHDKGGFIQLLAWKVDPSTSQTALDMIAAIDTWKNGVMGLYFTKKAALYADQPYDLDYSSAGAAPYTFTQVMNVV